MAKQFGSITVSDLRELLASYDDDAVVTFASNYGDHGRTQQVHKLRGRIEEQTLRETPYSESGFAVEQDFEEEDEAEDPQRVLVIS